MRLKGAEVAKALSEKQQKEVEELRAQGIAPTLAMVRAGERPDDISYEKAASKKCQSLGIATEHFVFSEKVGEEELISCIQALGRDKKVHGILLFRPLPGHLDEERICSFLPPEKDVDGITRQSLAGVFTGSQEGFAPCTAKACMEILEHYGIDCAGKKAVVVGRSLVVGKPVSMLLLEKNATVTICHSHTDNLAALCQQADLVIAAAGKMQMLGKDYFRQGQVVLDVGIHVNGEGKLCGDVKTEEAEEIVEAITPVPGGVGAVTNSILAGNVVEAARRMAGFQRVED